MLTGNRFKIKDMRYKQKKARQKSQRKLNVKQKVQRTKSKTIINIEQMLTKLNENPDSVDLAKYEKYLDKIAKLDEDRSK